MSNIRRPIPWDRVAGAVLGEQAADADQLRQVASQMVPMPPPTRSTRPPPLRAEVVHAERHHQVRSLQITSTRLGNWDADVEADGLVLQIRPQAEDGSLVAVNGHLTVELHAPRTRGSSGRWAFSSLGQWQLAVRPEHFGPFGAEYQLTFQGVHPEFDLDVGTHGFLQARLVVAGAGTFEASQSDVRIRPYSALRDRLEQHTGRRFLPQEQTNAR